MPTDPLYDHDFVRWTQEQARELRDAARSRVNLSIDWENVAEEIEDLGKSVRLELRSRLTTILEHLLKLRHSPASDPSFGWRSTMRRTRDEIAEILDENPSLRPHVAAMISDSLTKTARRVATDLEERGEIDRAGSAEIASASFTEREVLADWFPEPSAAFRQ